MSELIENSHLQSNITMPVIRGEIALIVIILINSLGVVLMLYSGSGISAISSVPYAFSLVFPKISLGTWTYIFQGLLVLSLMIMRKKFVAPYLFSFLNLYLLICAVFWLDLHSVRCWIYMKCGLTPCRQLWDTEWFIL